ncbi:MAG: 5'/3'-nucleotidase SurE [Planctomycetes bacterium]|nr:5'/3'-nucleotidase SurE [Planctomycetota bacterium]
MSPPAESLWPERAGELAALASGLHAHVLVSNDDGVDSLLTALLVEALLQRGDRCTVVAPFADRSWIGRAMTHFGEIRARPYRGLPCEAWSVEGTPADCVNLALHHLLSERPALVLAGINIGVNIGTSLCSSSGTVGAALGGYLHGLPAVAVSAEIPALQFANLKERVAITDESVLESLRRCAGLAADMVALIARPQAGGNRALYNINFPHPVSAQTEVATTFVDSGLQPSLFVPCGEGSYRFGRVEVPRGGEAGSDVACVERGAISVSRLDRSSQP